MASKVGNQIQYRFDSHEITFRNETRLSQRSDNATAEMSSQNNNSYNVTNNYNNSNSIQYNGTHNVDKNISSATTQNLNQQQEQQQEIDEENIVSSSVNGSSTSQNDTDEEESFANYNNSNSSSLEPSTTVHHNNDVNTEDNQNNGTQQQHHIDVNSLNQTDFTGISNDSGTYNETTVPLKTKPKGFSIPPPAKTEPPKAMPPPRNEATLSQNETSITEGLIDNLFNFQASAPNTSHSENTQTQQMGNINSTKERKKPPQKGFYAPMLSNQNKNKKENETTKNISQTAANSLQQGNGKQTQHISKQEKAQSLVTNEKKLASIIQGALKEISPTPQKTPKIVYVPVAVMAKHNKGSQSTIFRGKYAFPMHASKLLKHFHNHKQSVKGNGSDKLKPHKNRTWKKKKHVRKYNSGWKDHKTWTKSKNQNASKQKARHHQNKLRKFKKHKTGKSRRAHRKMQVNGQVEHQTKIFNQKHRHPMEGHRYGGEIYQHTHKMASHDFSKQVGHYGVHDDDSDSHSNNDPFAEISPNTTTSKNDNGGNQQQRQFSENRTPTAKTLHSTQQQQLSQRKVDDANIVEKINQFTTLAEHLADNLSNFNRGKGWKPKQDPDWRSFLKSREHLKDIEVGKKKNYFS